MNEFLILYLRDGINSEALCVYMTIAQRMWTYLIAQYIRFNYYRFPEILYRLQVYSYQKIIFIFQKLHHLFTKLPFCLCENILSEGITHVSKKTFPFVFFKVYNEFSFERVDIQYERKMLCYKRLWNFAVNFFHTWNETL